MFFASFEGHNERMKRTLHALAALLFFSTAIAVADENPTYTGPLSPTETTFVSSIQKDLMQRFPTAADAQKAGYFRYTNEDETGAISYANLQWQSADPKHPSQLWYDKNGKLLGADYSSLYTSSTRPAMFGVNPGRLYEFGQHVHWVQQDGSGHYAYDKYVMADKFKAAGGDPAHPTAADLVKMGKVKSANEVVHVFEMPHMWDMIVWVRPNPSGAFAEKNPNVKP